MTKKRRYGHAFSDQVIKVTSSLTPLRRGASGAEEDWKDSLITGGGHSPQSQMVSSWRKFFLLTLFIGTFFALFLRLFHLQVVQGSMWRDLADSNRIQIKVIHAPRGVIYDRNGQILAQNEPGFRLVEKDPGSPAGVKIEHITRDQAIQMEVNNDPRYNDLEIDSIRSYPLDAAAAHIIGYMGQITSEELKEPQYSGYKIGDEVGRGGIEQEYESALRGTDGGQIIEVDSKGSQVQVLGETAPIPGQNIYLTIDASLQEQAYQDLKNGATSVKSCCGAIAAEDPNSGQILALASYPSFDPTNIGAALSDPNSPLLDRAISGTYPPGSTFKIASALAGLSSGKITPQTIYQDNGIMHLGPYTFANWYYTQYGKTEGPVDMLKALQRSNDTYFYNLGNDIGETLLGNTAKRLGLGAILGIDLPGEEPGLIPTDAWKEKNIGTVWYPGDTLHMAIGQGYVLATPLQVLNLISEVASGGKSYPPHLALKITNPDNNFTIKKFDFSGSPLGFKAADISLVQKGLQEVPAPGGTAWPFFNFTIPTAGKTGSAEFGDPKDNTHAWYASYAPFQSPKLSAVALVEAGGEGSNTSAPIIKQLYTWYFSKDKTHLSNFDVAPVATASAKQLGE